MWEWRTARVGKKVNTWVQRSVHVTTKDRLIQSSGFSPNNIYSHVKLVVPPLAALQCILQCTMYPVSRRLPSPLLFMWSTSTNPLCFTSWVIWISPWPHPGWYQYHPWLWLTVWELLHYGAMVVLWSTHAVGCKGRHSCKVSPTCQWLRHSSNLSIKGERLPILSVGAWQKSSTTFTGITTAMTARLLAILSLLLVARQLTGESKKPHAFKTSTYNVCCLNYMQWYTT